MDPKRRDGGYEILSRRAPRESRALDDLLALFGDSGDASRFGEVAARDVPPPYDGLLVHDAHMTVTLESYHGGPVHLRVHGVHRGADTYARKITLHAGGDAGGTPPQGPPVLLGIMRFDFRYCTRATRDEILAGRTPLGRILIEHDILRALRAGPYYRVSAGEGILGVRVALPADCHARAAQIECNGGQAVQVLEIITAV